MVMQHCAPKMRSNYRISSYSFCPWIVSAHLCTVTFGLMVLWPLDFQIQKRLVSAETIWRNTVSMKDHNSYLSNHTVSSAQSRVNFGTHTNESSWNRKHHFILFSKQGDNSRSDWLAGQFAIAVLGNKSRSHFDLLANFEDTLENRTSGHTSF